MPRLSIYLLSLLYPAFLGSFLYGFFAAPMRGGIETGMMLCMLLYFAAQFGESARHATAPPPPGDNGAAPAAVGDSDAPLHPYRRRDAAIDLVEIALMAAFFVSVDGFGAQAHSLAAGLRDWLPGPWAVMAFAFLLSPVGRIVTGKVVRLPAAATAAQQARVHRRLCALSMLATGGAITGALGFACLGLSVVALALALYYALFVLFPGRGTAERLW